jgi:hypothetical protein
VDEARLAEIEARCRAATAGPWMVQCDYLEGGTRFSCLAHVAPAVVPGREYWPDDYEPSTDDHGYFRPDGVDALPDYKLAQAELIAHAPLDLSDLVAEVRRLRALLAGREGDPCAPSA